MAGPIANIVEINFKYNSLCFLGMLNLDEAVMNQPTFKKIMEDGIVTEQEIKEQSERIVSILKSMEKNYTEEQQREIKELLVEAGVLFTTSQYHALQSLHF